MSGSDWGWEVGTRLRAADASLRSSTRVSTSVFHSPQARHWPDHLSAVAPHDSQT